MKHFGDAWTAVCMQLALTAEETQNNTVLGQTERAIELAKFGYPKRAVRH
jgi:hypothetical protein